MTAENNIDEFVADNRKKIRRVGGRFDIVDGEQDRDLSFGASAIDVGVGTPTVYKRDTGSQITFGHPDPEHGFGRGTFGDDRGEWVEAGSSPSYETVFTKDGRRAVSRALDGKAGAVTALSAGVGTSTPSTSDASLSDVYASAPTRNERPATGEVQTVSVVNSAEWVGDPSELGLFDGAGRLLLRIVASGTWSIGTDFDVRVDMLLIFTGDGTGSTTVTSAAEDAVADSMAFPLETTGPTEFAFGSGGSSFSKSSTSLADEQFRKDCERLLGRDSVTARTHVFESEPSGNIMPVDLQEIGLYDNDGRLLWATLYTEFEKTDDVGFNAESTFKIS